MRIVEASVRRPIATFIFWIIPSLIGLYSLLYHLPIDLFPEIEFPVISVTTRYENVAPGEIETQITKPIEEIVSSIQGITSVRSRTAEGVSFVMLEFEYDYDLDTASVNIRERLDAIADQLPDDADSPIIEKFDVNLLFPVIKVDLFGKELDRTRRYGEDHIKPLLESLSGVASARVVGGLDREIQVNVDLDRLRAYDIPAEEVIQSIARENLNRPAGKVDEGNLDYLIRTLGEYGSLDEIRDTLVAVRDKTPIRIRHVADVEDGYADQNEMTRYNSKPSVTLEVRKESGGNSVAVADAVKALMPEIRKRLPPDISAEISADNSTYIKNAIAMVRDSAVQGSLLAILILLPFLKSIRSTLVIAFSIPLCLVCTFFPMYLFDMTLNMCSLGGLALGAGMVVDNAIVVIENMTRHRSLDPLSPKTVIASRGTSEVALAISASTFTTLAVYFPIIFVKGIAGEIFADLAFAILFCLSASLLVAVTVIPMLGARMSVKAPAGDAPEKPPGWLRRSAFGWSDALGRSALRAYESLLEQLTRHWTTQALTLAGVIGLFAFTLYFVTPGRAFFPKMDQDIFNATVELPVGSTLDRTDRVVGQVEAIVQSLPEVRNIATKIEQNQGTLLVTLSPKRERKRAIWDVVDDLRERVKVIHEAEVRCAVGDSGGGGDFPVEIRFIGPDDEVIRDYADRIAKEIAVVEDLSDIQTSFDEGKPEVQIRIDRAKAADLGLTTGEIADAMEIANLGKIAGLFRVGDDEYDIRVRARKGDRQTVSALENIRLVSRAGVPFALSEVAVSVQDAGPVAIDRDDQQRLAYVWAQADEDRLEEINKKVQAVVDTIPVPAGYRIESGGQFSEMIKAFAQLAFALLFAIILVYCVMAAQFESFIQPFIIMFTVPMALIGVYTALVLTDKSLSLSANVGIIMLAGIVVNNAILLIDYANMLRAEGLTPLDAIRRAGMVRLRPVMMTTLTTVLGMLPLAMGWGEGNEFFQPMAIATIGGLSVSTLLTLLFIPAAYLVAENLRSRAVFAWKSGAGLVRSMLRDGS